MSMNLSEKVAEYKAKGYETPDVKLLKTKQQIAGMKESSKINIAVLDDIEKYVAAGVTTGRLDELIRQKTVALGGIPAPLNYQGFPKSCCISINDVVCHGIPSDHTVIRDGDIVNIDVSTIYHGYFSDSSRMYCIGNVSSRRRRLVEVARECMELGIKQVKPWGFLGDIGHAVRTHAERNRCSVVREIGGHGIGLAFHEEPWVSYVARKGTGMLLVPGLVFTVEPMINMGRAKITSRPGDDWTVYTADGTASAQWEKTVLVTEDGCEILTY